jgi:hypothetical protein
MGEGIWADPAWCTLVTLLAEDKGPSLAVPLARLVYDVLLLGLA